jgi:hypothetical protein
VGNLPATRETLVAALIKGWQAHEPLDGGLTRRLKELVESRQLDLLN